MSLLCTLGFHSYERSKGEYFVIRSSLCYRCGEPRKAAYRVRAAEVEKPQIPGAAEESARIAKAIMRQRKAEKPSYRCGCCGGTFEYEDGWTDEDARVEAAANGFDPNETSNAVVCDDCYRAIGFA